MEGMIGVVFQSAYSASDGQFQESAMLAAGRVGNGKGGVDKECSICGWCW